MNSNLSLQDFYNCCKQEIYNNSDLYNESLEILNKLDNYENKGIQIIVKSWLNTIDSIDISMLLTETLDIINKLIEFKENALYLTIITEITIILNNIFYSNYKSYKSFWISNTNNLYIGIIYNFQQINYKNEFKKITSIKLETNDYYHIFFNSFQDKCKRLCLNIDFKEYYL